MIKKIWGILLSNSINILFVLGVVAVGHTLYKLSYENFMFVYIVSAVIIIMMRCYRITQNGGTGRFFNKYALFVMFAPALNTLICIISLSLYLMSLFVDLSDKVEHVECKRRYV